MNILFFVIFYLMLLSVMTFGRLESFLGFSAMQKGFLEAMQKKEPEYYSQAAVRLYQSTVATKNGDDDDESEESEQNSASSKLSFNLFLSKEQRESYQKVLPMQIQAAKKLMEYLYKNEPFYKKGEEKYGDLSQEIIQSLINWSNTNKPKKAWKNAKEIANVDLGDEELNQVFTKMLEGTVKKETIKTKDLNSYFLPDDGVFSLLDMITVQSDKLKIRVYLASAQVLMALFDRPDVVNSILQERKRLFYAVDSGKTTPQDAAKSFKEQFLGQQAPGITEEMLDFGVSKTYPGGRYE
jgi:hypothetical protein